MDEVLRDRYAALVELAEPRNPFFGFNSFVALIRPMVEAEAAERMMTLRSDAKYFLLLNLSEMILRPYAADVPTPPTWWIQGRAPELLARYRDFTPDRTIVRIGDALRIILENITSESDPDGVSAHQVLRAIDRSWAQLSDILAWG